MISRFRLVHNERFISNKNIAKSANEQFAGGGGKSTNDSLAMKYDNLHNITSKEQHISQTNVQFSGALKTGYYFTYEYKPANKQQATSI